MQLFGTSGIRGVVDKNLAVNWTLRLAGCLSEPKIRLTVEAKSKARERQLYDSGIRAIKECMEE